MGSVLRERFATEFRPRFFELGGETESDITADAFVGLNPFANVVYGGLGLGGSFACVAQFACFGRERLKERDLVFEDFWSASWAVAWADGFGVQLLSGLECFDPLLNIAVARVVVSAVHAGISGEEDALVREPCEPVSMGVRDSEVEEFNADVSVIEYHVF